VSLSVFAAAAEVPERTALVVEGREISFAELAARVERIPAPRPVLVGHADLDTLTRLYALIERGRPAVLVHPRWTAGERARFLAACGEIEPDPSLPDDERPLAVVPTSGTSGEPKGVVLSRRAFAAAAAASAANLGWRDDDRWLLNLPIAHVGGLSVITRCLLARRPMVVHPSPHFDAAEVAALARRRRVTLMSLVPTALRRLLESELAPPARLRAVLVGGAAASPALLASAAGSGWPVLATYGLTEACSQVATAPYGTRYGAETGCGPPLPGVEVRIRDGVIEVRGPQLMSGYLPPGGEPFTADGWLMTGDLGRLDDAGRLHVAGRRDAVIVSGGENVHAEEVERVLEEHPAIDAACVFGVADDEWGEVVAAALAAREPPSDGELERHLRERLAPFKVPRRIAYLPELARLPSGKVDRREAAGQARPGLRRLGG